MSSKNRAHGARPWGGAPRSVAIPTVLLLVAPLLVLVFAAVIFGMGARPRLRARTAADVAAAPAPALERTSTADDMFRGALRASRDSRTRSALQALRPTSARALASAAAIAAGVLFASTGALGSFAYLNSQKSIGSGGVVLTAATLGLSVNGAAAGTPVTLASAPKLLAGDYFSQNITVANTGNTAGLLAARLSAVPAPYEVRFSYGACPVAGYTTTALTNPALTTTNAVFGAMQGGVTEAACVQIGLLSSAAATGTSSVTATVPSMNVTVAFDFTQVSS